MISQFSTLPFRPVLFAPNGHLQTVLGTFGRKHTIDVFSHQHILTLQDGDKLSCHESIPHQWKKLDPTVILVHGLGGTHDSLYMIRMAKKLIEESRRVIRVNLRGCGSGIGLCQRPYHSGLSDDILNVIKHFQIPSSPTVLLGYSLGGNIALKLAGEQGYKLRDHIKGVIVVCPPFDLNLTVDKIIKSRFGFYERYFLYTLCSQYKDWAKNNQALNPPKLPKKMTLIGFDDFHTAPRWGFQSARHYYKECSSARFIPEVKIPCDIICTEDDPVVDTETIHKLALPPCIKVWKVPKGGHMGFLGFPWPGNGERWLDYTLSNFISKHLQI